MLELKMSESIYTKSVLFELYLCSLVYFFYFNLDAGQFRFKRDPGWRVGGRRSAPPFVSVFTCGIHGAV